MRKVLITCDRCNKTLNVTPDVPAFRSLWVMVSDGVTEETIADWEDVCSPCVDAVKLVIKSMVNADEEAN